MTTLCSRCVFLFLIAYCNMAFSFETHCADETQAIFNCRLEKSNKIVSVCKIGAETTGQQYLQYTFGRIGKPELVFPKGDSIRPDQFSLIRQYSNFAGYLEYGLEFTVGHNKYNIYWIESSKTDGEPKEEIEILSGIKVLTSTGKSIDLKCSKDVVADFMSGITTFVINSNWAEGQ